MHKQSQNWSGVQRPLKEDPPTNDLKICSNLPKNNAYISIDISQAVQWRLYRPTECFNDSSMPGLCC